MEVEFDVWHKYIFLHLLAYGIDLNNEKMKKFYSKDKRGTEADIVRIFSQRNIKELIEAIHEAGGIAVLAHPCCCWALSMDKFVKDLVEMGLDGIEVFYPYPRWRKYIKFSNPESIEKIADKYGLIKTEYRQFDEDEYHVIPMTNSLIMDEKEIEEKRKEAEVTRETDELF